MFTSRSNHPYTYYIIIFRYITHTHYDVFYNILLYRLTWWDSDYTIHERFGFGQIAYRHKAESQMTEKVSADKVNRIKSLKKI
jgi:hypothetical protein